MAKYKAKSSYLELENDSNYIAYSSLNKHNTLLRGGEINSSDPPEELKEHLTLVREPKAFVEEVKVSAPVVPNLEKKTLKKGDK